MVVKSRGYGKTWLTALCCIAMGVLYPGSLIAVVSGTAEQATLIVKKIQDYFIHNSEIMREIQCDGHRPVQLSRNKGVCTLKNGSKIESYSVGTMRGNRAKIMVIDESPEVKADDLDAVIGPVRNTKRDICHQRGIADYPSKTISITSACLKSNYFYAMFISALRDFAKGSTGSFACALDYRSAARVGITDMEFFQKEQRKMPEAKFAMEYGSTFVGAESGSMFPYDLTEGCRTLRQVEYAQPSGSSSDYVIGVDLATSTDRKADNAVHISKSWCTCAPIMESVWIRWRKKFAVPFLIFRERRVSYLTIAVWATPSRNSSRSRGSIRNPARSIRRGRWMTSGRSSTMPYPSCAASRPARRSTSSWCPVCAWQRSSIPLSCRSAHVLQKV